MAKVSFSSLFSEDVGVLQGFTFQNEAMANALAKAKESKLQKVAENAASLFEAVDRHNNALLECLRRVRKQEKVAKENLEKFKKAAQHFLDTGNFGPLYPYIINDVTRVCSALGVDLPTKEEQEIPK